MKNLHSDPTGFNRRPNPVDSKRRIRAAALIAVFWAIAILSIAVFTAGQFLLFEVESSSAERDQFRAEQLAEMAIAIGANPEVVRGDPVLVRTLSPQESYRGIIGTEGARLNLNFLLTGSGREVIENLFVLWGVPQADALAAVDAMVDWVDSDDTVTGTAGAERSDYDSAGFEGRPYNRHFRDLNEVKLVAGMERVARIRPDWFRAFTLWSGGPLDLNEAPADLIQAACGCSAEIAIPFVESRNGPDGVPGTFDDVRFAEVEDALAALGFPGAAAVSERFSVKDSVTRLTGFGTAGDVTVERTVVIRNRLGTPALLNFESRRVR